MPNEVTLDLSFVKGRAQERMTTSGRPIIFLTERYSAWDAWQELVDQLSKDSGRKTRSAVAEIEQTRR